MYNPDYIPPIHGCQNTGNLCWFNAFTQLLLSLSAFNEFILRRGGDNDIKSKFVKLYRKYLEQVLPIEVVNRVRQEEGMGPYIAERDVINVSNISAMLLTAFMKDLDFVTRRMYQIGQQESPVPGFVHMLDAIRCEEVYRYFNSKYVVSTKCSNCLKLTSTTDDREPLIKIYKNYPIRDPEGMERWLRYHKEIIDDYTCEFCKSNRGAYRTERLAMLREIVLISWNMPSNDRYVPDGFTLPESYGNTIHYKLIGQIEWSGNYDGRTDDSLSHRGYSYASSGHYWSTVMRPSLHDNGISTGPTSNMEWFRANDENFRQMDKPESNKTILSAYHVVSIKPMTEEEKIKFGVLRENDVT